jgi:hypothetical protein
MSLDLSILGLLAAFITAVVELIKAWVPCKFKDEKGILIPRKGKTPLHIPNQAVWPTLSLLIGVGVFLVLQYNIFGDTVNGTAGAAVAGGASAMGSNGVFRLKNKLGNLFGGTDDTNAQNSGPKSLSAALDDVIQQSDAQAPTDQSTTPPVG